MKKLILIFVVLLLLTACAETKSETVPEIVDELIEESIDDKGDEKQIEDEVEQNENMVTEEEAISESKDINEEIEEIKVDTGKFNGLADANFFEVKISGVPDTVPPKMFMLTDDVREKFQELNLQQDDEIKIYYYETTEGQFVVTDIEKI